MNLDSSDFLWSYVWWEAEKNTNPDKKVFMFNPLSGNSIKWSSTLNKFFVKSLQIIWLCLTIFGVYLGFIQYQLNDNFFLINLDLHIKVKAYSVAINWVGFIIIAPFVSMFD